MAKRTFEITDIWYDTYDEEAEGDPFYDEHGNKQSSEQPGPQNMTITLDEDDYETTGDSLWFHDVLLNRISDESGFCVHFWNYVELDLGYRVTVTTHGNSTRD